MASGWRIVRASRARVALTGEGAWRNGGRWNSPGQYVVYVSEHQSTAALEIFVHTVPFLVPELYKAFRLEWPDSLMEELPKNKWPPNWRSPVPSLETIEIGDRWLRERRSAVLAVPSAISPEDRNFLLNPAHPDFERIRIAPPINCQFDPRLLGR
jgi:RES domain-containing protein